MKTIQLLILFVFLCGLSLNAKLSTPKFFSDNMVLQRDIPVNVWGKANKGEKIQIEFNGKTYSTETDKKGNWKLAMDPMKAGGPYSMTISTNKEKIVYSNILMGDVWICSGQSNMEWTLIASSGAEEAIKTSENKNIRFLTVDRTIEVEEQEDIKSGGWQLCNPQTAPSFSAVGYFFGRELQEDLDVPIGLINTSWGGTDIQPWTSWEVMQQDEKYKKYAGKSIAKSFNYDPKGMERFQAALLKDKGDKEKWYLPTTKTNDWKKMKVPSLWETYIGNEDGIIWFRTEIDLPASAKGKKATLSLGSIDDGDYTYLNGTLVGHSELYTDFRTYSVESGILKSGKNVIVVRILDTGGGGGIYGNPEDLFLTVDGTKYPLAGEWIYKPSTISSQYNVSNVGPNNFASLLYNGMIKPFVGYGIKGAIWYQGENNAHEAYKYRTLFPNMITDWRNQWGYDFPFFWVQLANYMAVRPNPSESAWAELREAQNMTLSLPKTGQAVITDIGDANDIHPRNKKDVGHRLALNALKVAYGKDVVASGPIYKSMEKQGNKIILKFDNAQGLAPRDGNKYGYVRGFSIAGTDRKFVWAKAYVEGDKVYIFNDKITDPVAVRYAWADNPDDNDLVNGVGLLASPFRTDDWPGVTGN